MQTRNILLTSFAEVETTNLPLRFRATLVPQESSGQKISPYDMIYGDNVVRNQWLSTYSLAAEFLSRLLTPRQWCRQDLVRGTRKYRGYMKLFIAHKMMRNTTPDNRFTALFRNHPGEPVPEKNFWTLWCKRRLTEADTLTIRLGATPSGLTSAHLHHSPHFFTGRMPFLPPNQQCQSTEGKKMMRNNTLNKVRVAMTELPQLLLWTIVLLRSIQVVNSCSRVHDR